MATTTTTTTNIIVCLLLLILQANASHNRNIRISNKHKTSEQKRNLAFGEFIDEGESSSPSSSPSRKTIDQVTETKCVDGGGKIHYSASLSVQTRTIPWIDNVGNDCSKYIANSQMCSFDSIANMRRVSNTIPTTRSAIETCCICGGGSKGCIDKDKADGAEWSDGLGNNCGHYKLYDGACDAFGDYKKDAGSLSAKEACCACGGGRSYAYDPDLESGDVEQVVRAPTASPRPSARPSAACDKAVRGESCSCEDNGDCEEGLVCAVRQKICVSG